MIIKEPTYELKLTPQDGSLLPSHQNLDAAVDKVIQHRFNGVNAPKTRKKVAHSLMHRPDQNSALKIKLQLAKDQGLIEKITPRLGGNQELAEFVFSDCKEENFEFLLTIKTRGDENLMSEVRKIRVELYELTRGTTKYYRPQQTPPQTIPSSADRTHPDVQNGRMNLDAEGHVIYSTGRIETERKALQVLDRMIPQTLSSGQIMLEDLTQQPDGSYLYPVIIENLIGTSPLVPKERKHLDQEDAVLKALSGTHRKFTLPDGREIDLKLQLMHFSTQTNINTFLGQSHRLSCTGSDIAEQITQEGFEALEAYYTIRKENLPESTQQATDYCLRQLKTCTHLQDRLMLRAFLCELLNIPYHVHCKSSKDRTSAVAAIKKALHLWLKVETWKGDALLPDPREFFNNSVFREYSEASFFENLPLTDQGVGIEGVLDGVLYTQDRGFNYSQSILEHPLPASVLTDRHLYTASIIERVAKAALWALASLVLIPLSPVIIPWLIYKHGKGCLKAYSCIFLSLLLIPAQSGFRRQWIDRDDKVLKARSFLLKHQQAKTAPALQKLYTQVNNMQKFQDLLQFVKDGEGTISEENQQILKAIAENWVVLQKTKSAPSRVRALVKAGEKSNLTLFHLLRHYNQTYLEKTLCDYSQFILWPAEYSYHQLANNPPQNGITYNLSCDLDRTHYVIQGKNQRYDFPAQEEVPNRLENLKTALSELSSLNGMKDIPFEVQEALSQQTALSYVVMPIEAAQTLVERIFTIEEGDASHFYLTLQEKAKVKQAIFFDYSYRLKLSKSETGHWSTEFVSFSPVHPTLVGEPGKPGQLGELLEPVEEKDVKAIMNGLMQGHLCETLIRTLDTLETLEQNTVFHEKLAGQAKRLTQTCKEFACRNHLGLVKK